jgi:cell division protease FtsH
MVQLVSERNQYLGGYGAAKPFSEETARIIDAEVIRIINESHELAKSLLQQHRAQLDALVEALLARETLDEQEILKVTGLPPAPALESSRVAAAVHP